MKFLNLKMGTHPFRRILLLLLPFFLYGCAANQLAGFQNAYQGYSVPETLVSKIRVELKKNGLNNAQVTRDNVGRIKLIGSYRNEDEVDMAFVIVQSIIGLKSTSPLYPENILEKRWEINAKRLLEANQNEIDAAPPSKRALIIGINNFLDNKRLTAIMGEDDAKVVELAAKREGYKTTTLLGEQATKNNIENALEKLKRELGRNDVLLIYISSHGTPPVPSYQGGDTRKMSIAAYDSGDVNAKKTDTSYQIKLMQTSVADTKVQELAQMPTKMTRVIIDTCYSGEILKDIPDDSARYILQTNGGVPEQAGISIAAWSGNYAAKGIVFSNDSAALQKEKGGQQITAPQKSPQSQFDMGRFTIITATSDGEKSWGPSQGGSFASPTNPNKRLQGSFFTQSLFEFLNKYEGHLEPAFKAARNFTSNKVSNDVSPQQPRPVQQTPRLNPPLPPGDASSLYK